MLGLISDMPDYNRNWKGRYFFIKGTDLVCRLEEWDTMPYGFDNTWGIVKDSSLMPNFFFNAVNFSSVLMSSSFFLFQLVSVHPYLTSRRPSSNG